MNRRMCMAMRETTATCWMRIVTCCCSSDAEQVHSCSVFFFKQKRAYEIGLGIPAEPLFRSNLTSKEAKMGKVMRHTLGASLNIRHNLSSSKGPKPLQLKLLTTYIPKTSAFTLAFSTSQRLRTTRASARTFFTFRHYITPSARNF